MIKKIGTTFLIIIVCFMVVGCGKQNSDLLEIAKIINNSETVKTYKEYGNDIKATVDNNTLIISSKYDDNKTTVKFDLVDNILSNEKLSFDDLMSAILVIDSVGQLHGYKDGELSEIVNAFPDDIKNYTTENEGLEFKNNGDTSLLKIDISKKIPLVDMSSLYLKPEDFDTVKDLVNEKSVGNQTGAIAKLAYDVQITDEYNYIYIGERDELTKSSYKSILSALEVMYGPEVSSNFESLYPEFKNDKTTVDAFTIETNYEKDDADESIFKDKKIVLVTIDNSIIKK